MEETSSDKTIKKEVVAETRQNGALKHYMNPRVWVGRRPVKATLETAKFMFFYGSKFEEHENFSLDYLSDLFKHAKFKPARPTVLYFHGYLEKMTDEHIEVIVDAYQTRDDHNLIMMNWNDLADGSYVLDAIPNAIKLGKLIGEKIVELSNAGFDISRLHIVGHSLGGQMAGYVGRTVIDKSDSKLKIKRITALDPAFPGFYPAVFGKHLSYKDAEFVDTIHTDAWLYGTPSSVATADFWPNSGKTLQPGCPKRNYKMLTDNDLCSHRRSWHFWAESVKEKDTTSFQAVKCESWSKFKAGGFDRSAPVALMGINCPLDAKGDYYLQTKGEYPYSKGIAGTTYAKDPSKIKSKKK